MQENQNGVILYKQNGIRDNTSVDMINQGIITNRDQIVKASSDVYTRL